jgi:hypothetical protein
MTTNPSPRARRLIMRPLLVLLVVAGVLWWGNWRTSRNVQHIQDAVESSVDTTQQSLIFTDDLVRDAFGRGLRLLRNANSTGTLRLVDVEPKPDSDTFFTARLTGLDDRSMGLLIQYDGNGNTIIAGVDLEPRETVSPTGNQ